MSTRSKPPTDISGSGPEPELGEDEQTIVQELAGDTPADLPRCSECGAIAFYDEFSEPAAALASGLFGSQTCIRARDAHWWYCADLRKYVYIVPR